MVYIRYYIQSVGYVYKYGLIFDVRTTTALCSAGCGFCAAAKEATTTVLLQYLAA